MAKRIRRKCDSCGYMVPARQTEEEMFFRKCWYDADTGCVEWMASRDGAGYGKFGRSGRSHRWAYEFEHGPIPAGLVIDHLCENKGCCNPEHLEAVSPGENSRRARYGYAPFID